MPLLSQLEEWCGVLGEVFTPMLFIYGPIYNKNKKPMHVLLNFLFRQAKMAIWLSRKGKINNTESTEVILKGLIISRIKVEYAFITYLKT